MYLLSSAGYSVTGETEDADIVLLNTCGFIESAKTEAIETILELAQAKKKGKTKKLIVAGCLAQRYKNDILKELPEIDAVLGTGSFDDIVDIVKNNIVESFNSTDAPVSETPRIISTSPAWAYLKIAEGCDNFCAYCCIPEIRGRFRSRPMENIVAEASRLADSGILEIIIVAQDVTMYGLDLYGKHMLPQLLTELNKIEKLKWIRLHYLYPASIDDRLIDVIAKSDKILKYLDIPIQHINNKILKKMNRKGSGNDIRNLLCRLRERIPGVVLRTSIITGLPGEGDNEFNELYGFLVNAKIERAGIFTYSPEEGTKAAMMNKPSKEIAEERAKKLTELQSHIMTEWNKSRIGTFTDVLVEDKTININGKTHLLARSYAESPDIDGYITLQAKPLENRSGYLAHNIKKLNSCRITGVINGELTGKIL